MAGKTKVEMTLETVVEFQDLHERRLREAKAALEESQSGVNRTLEALAAQVAQTNAGLERLEQTVEHGLGRMERAVERAADSVQELTIAVRQLSASVDGHLRVAELQARLADQQSQTSAQQAASIVELTKLVTAQASSVDRLIERLSAK